MIGTLFVRRIKPGTYASFGETWEPEAWPPRMERLWLARSEDDPNVVAGWVTSNPEREFLRFEDRDGHRIQRRRMAGRGGPPGGRPRGTRDRSKTRWPSTYRTGRR